VKLLNLELELGLEVAINLLAEAMAEVLEYLMVEAAVEVLGYSVEVLWCVLVEAVGEVLVDA
jgi:hypothetical protein